MKKKYKKSTRPEKSTKKVQNLQIVKKKYSTFKKVRCGNTAHSAALSIVIICPRLFPIDFSMRTLFTMCSILAYFVLTLRRHVSLMMDEIVGRESFASYCYISL